jgi:hypothetical protein
MSNGKPNHPLILTSPKRTEISTIGFRKAALEFARQNGEV